MTEEFNEQPKPNMIERIQNAIKAKNDDLKDLFDVKREDILDTDDVVKVDVDRDILDADEDGTFDDLCTVDEEDVMGRGIYGQTPLEGAGTRKFRKKLQTARFKLTRKLPEIGSMQGMR